MGIKDIAKRHKDEAVKDEKYDPVIEFRGYSIPELQYHALEEIYENTHTNPNQEYERGHLSVEDGVGITGIYFYDMLGSRIHDSVSKLTTLRSLHITSQNLEEFPESFKDLEEIRELKLNFMNLEKIDDSFIHNLNLEKLELYQTEYDAIPDYVYSMNLKSLRMFNNKVTEVDDRLGQMKMLEELSLRSNNVVDVEPIKDLSNLQNLDIANNSIRGLPEDIGGMKSLVDLDAATNSIRTLPDSISELSKLKSLNVSSNRLKRLPESITKLKNLKNLYVSNNPLERMPDKLYDMTGLNNLLDFGTRYTQKEKERVKKFKKR